MTQGSRQTIETFFSCFPSVEEKRKTIILPAGEEPLGIYYLRSGYVKQYVLSDVGSPVIAHIFRPGSFFPLTWVFNNEPSSYIHETMTRALFYRAPKEDVREFLVSNQEALYKTSSRLMAGIVGLRKRIEILMTENARQRAIGLLVYLSEIIGQREGESVTLPVMLPHREIAAWIGTTRETASLMMESLARQGLVNHHGRRLSIPHIRQLKNLLK